jgi:hypothetical protein
LRGCLLRNFQRKARDADRRVLDCLALVIAACADRALAGKAFAVPVCFRTYDRRSSRPASTCVSLPRYGRRYPDCTLDIAV